MAIPLLWIAGTLAAAGAGWVVGKVAENSGDNIRSEANKLQDELRAMIEDARTSWLTQRTKVIEYFHNEFNNIERSTQHSIETDDSDKLRSNDIFSNLISQIENARYLRVSSARFIWEDSEKVARARDSGLKSALKLDQMGHPALSAAAAALATATAGIEHRTACKNFYNASRALLFEKAEQCDALINGLVSEAEELSKTWEALRDSFLEPITADPRHKGRASATLRLVVETVRSKLESLDREQE